MGRDPSGGPFDSDQGQKLFRDMEWFHQLVEKLAEDGTIIVGFSVRLPRDEGDDFFMVIRALQDGERVVAFRDGESLVAVMRGFIRHLKAKKLKFREDMYD